MTSIPLNDNKQFTVCVLLKNYRLLCCFHLGWSTPALIKIPPSQPTEVNAFSPDRTNGGDLSTLKAFSHCRTNLQHYCPDQDHFCSNSKAQDDVVNRYPRVSMAYSILVALGGVNYLRASASTILWF